MSQGGDFYYSSHNNLCYVLPLDLFAGKLAQYNKIKILTFSKDGGKLPITQDEEPDEKEDREEQEKEDEEGILVIDELPVKKWTKDYKKFLEKLIEDEILDDM